MFVLYEMHDTIRRAPRHMDQDRKECLEFQLNVKYSNKVIKNVGLSFGLWHIVKVEDGVVMQDTGDTYFKVVFLLIIFRPYIGEILMGTVKNCSSEGIQVSMGFFEDILIPVDKMKARSEFTMVNGGNAWVWCYVDEGEEQRLPLEKNDKIRFVVTEERWNDVLPTESHYTRSSRTTGDSIPGPEENATPYAVIGSITALGLGHVDWWSKQPEEGVEEEDADDTT